MRSEVVLIWLAANGGGSTGDGVGPAEARLLRSWASAHQVKWREPAEAASRAGPPPRDGELVEDLEQGLAAARLATDSLELEAATRQLQALEQRLEQHPELPEAPFLRAEVWRLLARALARTSADAETSARVQDLERRAHVMEGTRAAAFGASEAVQPAPEPSLRQVRGLRPGLSLYWDGDLVTGSQLSAAPGLHHLRVLEAGRAVQASWVELDARADIVLELPARPACSARELQATPVSGRQPRPLATTRCDAWALARSGPGPGTIQVARCFGVQCSPFLDWSLQPPAVLVGRPQPEPIKRWPEWATWMLVGAVAAGGSAIAIWRSGEFEREQEPRRGWTLVGPSSQALVSF